MGTIISGQDLMTKHNTCLSGVLNYLYEHAIYKTLHKNTAMGVLIPVGDKGYKQIIGYISYNPQDIVTTPAVWTPLKGTSYFSGKGSKNIIEILKIIRNGYFIVDEQH